MSGPFPSPLCRNEPRVIHLLHFKGIMGELKQATEKPVLFQNLWVWIFQAPVIQLKLEMTLVHSTSIRKGFKACGVLWVVFPRREAAKKLDLHVQLCPCRQSSFPSPHFSLHELIYPDSCQISPLTPGAGFGTATLLSFSSLLFISSVFLQPYFGGELHGYKALHRKV